jgi:hypothetical protein
MSVNIREPLLWLRQLVSAEAQVAFSACTLSGERPTQVRVPQRRGLSFPANPGWTRYRRDRRYSLPQTDGPEWALPSKLYRIDLMRIRIDTRLALRGRKPLQVLRSTDANEFLGKNALIECVKCCHWSGYY